MGYTQHPLGSVTTVVSAATAVATDPCLSRVAQLVLRLHQLEQARATSPKPVGATAVAAAPVRGIGLCQAVKPLEVVVWVRERPWVVPIGAVAVVGGLVGLGYLLGRRRR
jgi:hypothetical protein